MRSRAFDSQLDTYEGGVTALVIGSSLVAAMGAFVFGFDLGMSGWHCIFEIVINGNS